jgi:hypothetical protein
MINIKSSIILVLISLFIFTLSFSQAIHKRGKVVMALVDIRKGEDPIFSKEMQEMKMTEIFTENKFLSTTNYNSAGMEGLDFNVYSENLNGVMYSYSSIGGRKIKMSSKNKMPESLYAHSVPIIDKSNRKTILGFDCYLVSTEKTVDGKKSTEEMYVTDAISMMKFTGSKKVYIETEGFPLEITYSEDVIESKFLAIEFSPDVDETVFNFDKSAYKEVTDLPKYLNSMKAEREAEKQNRRSGKKKK